MNKKTTCRFLFTILFLALPLFSQSFNEEEIKNYLDEKEKIFEDISVQMGLANWNVYSQEGEADQDTPKGRYFNLFNDQLLIDNIKSWVIKKDLINDKTLWRRIEIWDRVLTGAMVDMDEEIFRLENKLEALLAENESEGAEEREKEVLKLMKLRNIKSRELGYKNYAEMMMDLSGFGMENFDAFVEQMLNRTEKSYLALLEGLDEEPTVSDVRRFIGMFMRNSGPSGIDQEKQMDIMKETLQNIGLNFDELPIRFVEKEIPYGGNALAVSIPDDMRIIMNLNMSFGVWMHEAGHGLHGVFTSIEYPILKGYEWNLGGQSSVFGEGMAEVGAEFIRNREWQLKYTSISAEELDTKFEETKKYVSAYIRYYFSQALIEVELYKDLSQNPKELRDKIYRKLFHVDSSELPFSIGNNIMIVSYPVYFQNYIFASVVAKQVHSALENKFGKDYMFNKEVGPWLIENFYASGELEEWRDKLKATTGKEFDVEGFFSRFGM